LFICEAVEELFKVLSFDISGDMDHLGNNTTDPGCDVEALGGELSMLYVHLVTKRFGHI
jgi:ribosome-binding ATPase YchF (GTP1/OBG family)